MMESRTILFILLLNCMMTGEKKINQFRNNHHLTIIKPSSFVYNEGELNCIRRHSQFEKNNIKFKFDKKCETHQNHLDLDPNEIISPSDIKINQT